MNGILLIDKPAGWTSHDVVAKLRGTVKAGSGQKIKIGHTGTLDPMATGLMIVVVGAYTKRAAEFSKLDKTYEAELTLGATSSTGDAEGEITKTSATKPQKAALEAVLAGFEGEISQTPHAYSAIKVGGQRAYKLARQGITPVIEPRQVKVHSIKLTDYDYPKVRMATEVSSGTYIRSLAEDVGEALGTGAYLSALRRVRVGGFDVKDALRMDGINYPTIVARFVTI